MTCSRCEDTNPNRVHVKNSSDGRPFAYLEDDRSMHVECYIELIIEKMLERKNAMRNRMEFIDINNSKPPDDDPVLLGNINSEIVTIGFYMGKGRVMKKGFWRVNDEGCAEQVVFVTHWCKLPEFPKSHL